MHLLFDLDGTLTDSFPGISCSINHTLVGLGLEPVPDTRLRGFVGAPLPSIFSELLASNDPILLERAVAAYCTEFDDDGIFENRVFPGIPEALATFRASGHTLQVVTARSLSSARRVVQHFALGGHFVAVHGPEPTDRVCDKADLVAAALTVAGSHVSEAVMVGDRAVDINAARAHGVRAVAAGWGYGSRAELTAAAPDHIAETVADLVAWVQSVG
jgi:phosphoglycolate phosphatase